MTQPLKLMYFSSREHCPACKVFAPVIDALDASPDYDIIHIDAETDATRVRHYGIRSLPTLLVLDDDLHPLGRWIGSASHPKITAWLAQWSTP